MSHDLRLPATTTRAFRRSRDLQQRRSHPPFCAISSAISSVSQQVIVSALSLSAVLYLMVGSAGYLTFGTLVEGNVLNSYPPGPITSTARVRLLACNGYATGM